MAGTPAPISLALGAANQALTVAKSIMTTGLTTAGIMANTAASASAGAAASGTTMMTSGIEQVQSNVHLAVGETSKTTIAGTAAGQAQVNAGVAQTSRAMTSIQNSLKQTMIDLKGKMRNQFDKVKQNMGLLKFLRYGIIFVSAVFGYLGKVIAWLFKTVKCSLTWFSNFRQCFFWYFLEIIGQIIYLPFRFLIWLLTYMGIYDLECVERDFWSGVSDVDCFIYSLVDFHLFRYSEEVMEKCYSCNPGPFPLPNLNFGSVEEFVVSVIKEMIIPVPF
jgi:hypothetical protein